MTPLVTVIVPTHDHAGTVDLAIESVLAQTVADLDVVVIGDGATDATRAAVKGMAPDPRVRFLDLPKSPSRGEEARHEVLAAARAPFVCYLGDDDLMLADHVETMLAQLDDGADFTHPAPLSIMADGSLHPYPTDIARAECRDWHLRFPERNAVSLSGVAHRLDAYRRLPHGWRPAPPGRSSDQYMWEQWFTTPGVRFRTGTRLTVLKFHGADPGFDPAERRAEIMGWRARMGDAGFADELAGLVADAYRRWAVQANLERS